MLFNKFNAKKETRHYLRVFRPDKVQNTRNRIAFVKLDLKLVSDWQQVSESLSLPLVVDNNLIERPKSQLHLALITNAN